MTAPIYPNLVCPFVKNVAAATARLAPEYVKFPDPANEDELRQQFARVAGLPGEIDVLMAHTYKSEVQGGQMLSYIGVERTSSPLMLWVCVTVILNLLIW